MFFESPINVSYKFVPQITIRTLLVEVFNGVK